MIRQTPPVAVAPAGAAAAGSTIPRRVMAAAVVLGATVVLGLAAYLTPSDSGLGTHRQLVLPSCGWIAIMDLPCPTCGMTTAFAHAANGNLIASLRAQPMGCALALATSMAWIVGVYVAASGAPLAGVFGRCLTRRAAWLLGGAFVLAWVYKVLSYKGVL